MNATSQGHFAITDRKFIRMWAAAFPARVIPSVAYSDPEVTWVGLSEDQARP